jgi:CheY-like chemotaxis protein
VDRADAVAHRDLRIGSYVRLSIRDNGIGMNKATMERIFEPFFTTKAAGKGSGLGLSVVHGIVQAHEGAITVESEPGKGALFSIYLPAQENLKEEARHEAKTLVRGNGENILLVDDEELPGRAMEKILSRLGYSVSRFNDPVQALAQFQSAPAQFQAVVSDMAMPHMSGSDLAGALIKLRPNIPVMLISGLMDEPAEEVARRTGVRKVLLKPVAVENFARELASLLASRDGV